MCNYTLSVFIRPPPKTSKRKKKSILAQVPAQSFTFIHHRVNSMRNSPTQQSFNLTQAISENKTSLWRPFNLSTVSWCSEQSTELSSETTSWT
jgi:hypothetical protein